MSIILALLLAAGADPSQIDPARLDAEVAADVDVIRSLRQNGDVETTVRPVDVRFVGDGKSISRLKQDIGGLGWLVIQTVPLNDGSVALDVQRNQTTEAASLRSLTEAALRIEASYGVHYDGWGTLAQRPATGP